MQELFVHWISKKLRLKNTYVGFQKKRQGGKIMSSVELSAYVNTRSIQSFEYEPKGKTIILFLIQKDHLNYGSTELAVERYNLLDTRRNHFYEICGCNVRFNYWEG